MENVFEYAGNFGMASPLKHLNNFTEKYQIAAACYDAMKRNWSVSWQEGIFHLTDAAGHVNETYFDGRTGCCNCEEYIQRDVGSCMHVEMIKYHRFHAKKYIKESSKMNSLVGVGNDGHGLKYWLKKASKTKFFDELPVGKEYKILPGVDRLFEREKSKLGYNEVQYNNINVLPGVTLRDYQDESVRKMLHCKRTVLTLKMGLGKTICALACIKLLNKPSVIIISPLSIKMQWHTEIKRFLGYEPLVISSSKDVEKFTAIPGRAVVINYELLSRNPHFMKNWDIVVMDEIQKIRNKETKLWKAMANVETDYLFALSGTVIENRVEDLISVVEILNPKELTPHWRFYSEFCETSRHKIRGFAKQSLSKLRSRLDRYIVNPDLSNLVLKIPEKIEHKIDLPWAFKKQKEAHDIPFESAKTMIARGESRPLTFAEQILLNGLLMKARLASNDYRLLDSEFIDPGEKIAAIKCLIQELCAAGRKVVVYSDWIKMLKLISRELDELKIGHTHFTGEMTPKKRNKSFEKFIYDQDVKVFLATDTGGVGIDGLQFVSDAVIHTEMVWNPAKYDQRNGRVVRNPNPSSKVDVYYISTQEGVEKMMQTSTSRKSALRQSFLGC